MGTHQPYNKQILIFISETFDKINRFQGSETRVVEIPVIGQVILSIEVLSDYSWLFPIAIDIHQCLDDVIASKSPMAVPVVCPAAVALSSLHLPFLLFPIRVCLVGRFVVYCPSQ